ncbi:MAG TPA: TlpA disulfide reductase family protein [Pirellula sp.]|nr:TlpA disulfide reductase family protein [Pirellula sp.]
MSHMSFSPASLPLVALLFAVGFVFFSPRTDSIAADKLVVGSIAPKLNVEHWVQNGGGIFPKVTDFKSGRVYVVEFWATTCGPCVQSMPHLAELQTNYTDKGLQIVSISSEPVEVVNAFLENELKDETGKRQKISEVTRSYCLTTDPDGSSDADYMQAAHQNGIPCAFIVGKDAKIEWIGHPMGMDDILVSVLEDKWDREKYIAEQQLIEEIQTTVGGLTRRKKFAEAAAAIDGYIAKISDRRIQFGLYKSKIDMQIRSSADIQDITKSYEDLFASCAEEPLFVQDVAWSAYEAYVENRLQSKKIIRTSIAAVEKTLPLVEGATKANLFDTIARLYSGIGDLRPAIQAQTQAVKLSDGIDQETFKEFLQELQNEEKKSKK